MKIILTCIISFATMVVVGQPTHSRKGFDKLLIKQVTYHKEATFSLYSLTSTIYNERFNKIKNKPDRFSIEDFECEIGTTVIANVLLTRLPKAELF